jgi:hypothetical protein
VDTKKAIGLGLAVGVIFGVALHNFALGLVIGVALGIGLCAYLKGTAPRGSDDTRQG